MSDEGTLFPRTPLERLLALKLFLEAEHGHRVHLLAQTREKVSELEKIEEFDLARKMSGKLAYWAKSVKDVDERLSDVMKLIEETR